jgi:PLP dependent protein
VTDARAEELAANLATLHGGLRAACEAADRDPTSVTLVAVTKTWPAEDVRRLASLGVTDVAENRDQEAADKVTLCRGLPLRWHFVGQVQTNKARSVASYADVVHAVDRERVAVALDRGAVAAGRRVRVLVQVNLADRAEVGRGGVAPADVLALCASVTGTEALDLGGVMGVAPLGADAGSAFARLEAVAAAVRAAHPDATWVSAGMSEDFSAAIRHGATHVRIGSALLGNRPPLR